jgi:sugar (pentulose or hexulose) kinase
MRTNKNGLIIALDLGTSNLKGAVYDVNGIEVAFESVEYNLYTPSKSVVENNVNIYWNNILSILKKLAGKLGTRVKEVIAIGTTSQGETIVPIDKNGNQLRNAIVWIDTRSTKEAEEISMSFNIKEMYRKTGYAYVDPSWPAARILWIKKNEPEVFSKTYKFLLLEDYIIYKLTGQFVGEASVYSSSYYYDIVKFEYINSMLDYLGINKGKLPEITKPGSLVGNITEEIAKIIGLNKNTKVVNGAMDQICGAVGAGNITKGIATESSGSAFVMVVTTGEPVFDDKGKLPCGPHAIPGLYVLMPYSSTGGMTLKWFKDVFCMEESRLAKKENKNVFKLLDDLAVKVSAGCEGLIMIPHITGAFFPEYNPNARGIYFGFSINHTKGHFIRAVLEALGFMMKNDIKTLERLGIIIEKVISVGGGAGSKLWGQIKTDICGINIEIPEYTETALLGTAMLTASSMGVYDSIADASSKIMKVKEVFYPDNKNKKIYNENFKKYINIYNNLKDLF